MQTWVLHGPTTDLRGRLNKAKMTVLKPEGDIYNVQLEKKAQVEELEKRASELSALKAQSASFKRTLNDINDAVTVCPLVKKPNV